MKEKNNQSIFTSLLLSALIALTVIFIWLYAGKSLSYLFETLNPPNTVFHLWKGIILVAVGALCGFLAEKTSIKRLSLYAVGFLGMWFFAAVAANLFLNISLFFIPLSLTILLTILTVQLKKLWLIDAELTEKLVEFALSGHLLEVKSADSRIESGLKLLETILPFSEAIVFRHEPNGDFTPIGRSRNSSKAESAAARQNDFRETAKRKRIRLVEQTKTPIPPIAGNQGLIRRAISNLVDNAIRYSPERTSVIISTILEADFLRVVVEDRGYGVPTNEQEKIWQKFYRVARDGQDKEEESTGLGLSLVKEVIEQYGGEVGVESENGQGSKFSFTLPRL